MGRRNEAHNYEAQAADANGILMSLSLLKITVSLTTVRYSTISYIEETYSTYASG